MATSHTMELEIKARSSAFTQLELQVIQILLQSEVVDFVITSVLAVRLVGLRAVDRLQRLVETEINGVEQLEGLRFQLFAVLRLAVRVVRLVAVLLLVRVLVAFDANSLAQSRFNRVHDVGQFVRFRRRRQNAVLLQPGLHVVLVEQREGRVEVVEDGAQLRVAHGAGTVFGPGVGRWVFRLVIIILMISQAKELEKRDKVNHSESLTTRESTVRAPSRP